MITMMIQEMPHLINFLEQEEFDYKIEITKEIIKVSLKKEGMKDFTKEVDGKYYQNFYNFMNDFRGCLKEGK